MSRMSAVVIVVILGLIYNPLGTLILVGLTSAIALPMFLLVVLLAYFYEDKETRNLKRAFISALKEVLST